MKYSLFIIIINILGPFLLPPAITVKRQSHRKSIRLAQFSSWAYFLVLQSGEGKHVEEEASGVPPGGESVKWGCSKARHH